MTMKINPTLANLDTAVVAKGTKEQGWSIFINVLCTEDGLTGDIVIPFGGESTARSALDGMKERRRRLNRENPYQAEGVSIDAAGRKWPHYSNS